MESGRPTGEKKSTAKLLTLLGSSVVAAAGLILYFGRQCKHQRETETRSVLHLEVCNMIAGNFKAKLAGMGNHCMLSVPTIITGGDYRLHSLADGGTIEVMLEFEKSLLWITLELHS